MSFKIPNMSAVPLVVLCATVSLRGAEPSPDRSVPRAEEVLDATKVWDVHLTFTPEQWKAMEPVQGSRPERGRNRSFLQGPEGGRNGIAAAFGIEFAYVRADLEFGPHRFKEVGVRYKGNGTFLSSREGLKRSMKIDMNQFVKGQKLGGMTQINLHNSVRDPSNMNESIAYRLFRDGGVPAPRTAHAKVFVSVPDLHDRKYFGLYNLVEDVGKHFVEQHFGTTDGALLKPVTPDLFGDLGDDWDAYNQTYDPKSKLSDEQKKRIIETCKFVSSSSQERFAAAIGDYFELENLARFMALTAWMSDLDGILGPGQNFYLHLHPTTRKFTFIPWDQDQTFGQFPRGTQDQREKLSIRTPWNGENRFLGRIFAVEAFQTRYRALLGEFNGSILQPERIQRQVDALASVLRAPIGEESAERLAGFDKAVAGETVAVVMGPGFREPVQSKPIKQFTPARWKSVDDQLAGRAEGERISGR